MDRYNHDELNKIEDLIKERRYKEALKYIRNYINDYPRDKAGKVVYAEILYLLNYLDESRDLIYQIELGDKVNQVLVGKAYLLKLKLALSSGKYPLAYNIYRDGYRYFKQFDTQGGYGTIFTSSTLYFFLKQRAGYLSDDEIAEATSYMNTQILAYDPYRMLDYVQNVNDGIEVSTFNHQNYKFNPSVSIEKLYQEVEELKDETYSYYDSPILRSRFYKYENVGYDEEGNQMDYINVVTFFDTNEIIVIVPTTDKSHLQYKDITPIKKTVKTKRLSQIEKFNKKYNLN